MCVCHRTCQCATRLGRASLPCVMGSLQMVSMDTNVSAARVLVSGCVVAWHTCT